MKANHAGFILIAMLVAIVLGAFISPWASSDPDGLEKVAEDHGFIESALEEPVWTQSPLPDYSVPAIENELLSTGLTGLVGTIAMFFIAFGVAKLVFPKKHETGKGGESN